MTRRESLDVQEDASCHKRARTAHRYEINRPTGGLIASRELEISVATERSALLLPRGTERACFESACFDAAARPSHLSALKHGLRTFPGRWFFAPHHSLFRGPDSPFRASLQERFPSSAAPAFTSACRVWKDRSQSPPSSSARRAPFANRQRRTLRLGNANSKYEGCDAHFPEVISSGLAPPRYSARYRKNVRVSFSIGALILKYLGRCWNGMRPSLRPMLARGP